MRITAARRKGLIELQQYADELVRRCDPADRSDYEAWSHDDSFRIAVALAIPWISHWQQTASQIIYFLRRQSSATEGVIRVALSSAAIGDQFEVFRHAYVFEELLAVSSDGRRKHKGVFYTPQPLAEYIVRRLDQMVRTELDVEEGLASEKLRILDPAAGSGVFLAEVIRHVRSKVHANWSDFVSHQLLPRLVGWELMPAATMAAQCVVASALAESGYDLRAGSLRIECRDALMPLSNEVPFNIVLGNPPYASLSTARHGWIEALITADYAHIKGERLGEKKHWLHDDYVKFLRLAQWHVQQSGCGAIGLVTNHGFLDNASFRGLRASLLDTFHTLEVLDLHGNAKLRERSPDGNRDENVFGIASGVAITVAGRRPDTSASIVRHAEVWGTAEAKLLDLERDNVSFTQVSPESPDFRLATSRVKPSCHYASAWRIVDAMPLNTTAPVTARDHFVVAFTCQELLDRMAQFCDLSIPDDVIRSRFFSRTRSTRYLPGDSRSWNLAEARLHLAADDNWSDCIRLCQYRPLDYRYVLWHEALIDWPRTQVIGHLHQHDNLAIIARRQSPRGLPANFFWATKVLALDGIIRSDNRGSESLFPLWRFDDQGVRQGNFAAGFLIEMQQVTGLAYPHELTPEIVGGYIYGLCWSPEYRGDHQPYLCSDFPRIVLPGSIDEFRQVSELGLGLLTLHTTTPSSDVVTDAFAEPSPAAWDLQIGAHYPARKWLKDRRNRELMPSERNWYHQLLGILEETAQLLSD